MNKYIRPTIYVGAFIALFFAILIKKDVIVEKRSVEAISIPNEIRKHGLSVDVKKVEKTDLIATTNISVTRVAPLTGTFFAAEEMKRQIAIGMPVYDLVSKKALGRVAQVPGVRDYQTGLYKITIQFLPESKIDARFEKEPNLTVALQLKAKSKVLAIPVDAIAKDVQGRSFVWTLNRDLMPERRAIRTGLTTSTLTEVVHGLSAGDTVVVEGQNTLSESVKVRVRKILTAKDSSGKEALP